jgi:lysophospholipase L1-like esterase
VIGNLVEILGKELQAYTNKREAVFYCNEIISLKKWNKKNSLGSDNTSLYFSDGMHPSELTYRIWGKEMGTFICKKYKKPSIRK